MKGGGVLDSENELRLHSDRILLHKCPFLCGCPIEAARSVDVRLSVLQLWLWGPVLVVAALCGLNGDAQ